jgi:hypothetical protein
MRDTRMRAGAAVCVLVLGLVGCLELPDGDPMIDSRNQAAIDPPPPAPAAAGDEPFEGTPPGAVAFGSELVSELRAALAARYPKLEPRTRHRLPGGLPRFTNRLVLEKSPYLLQHAHNPVNWFPWGAEAFELAARLDRPIFLSVGYSTCHWCHVMEEESFEDPEIAELLNQDFVAVKVDREERPDVDGLYMTAVQLMHGNGGWPMTVVMTPGRDPFFAGTYFPPRAGSRGSRMGLIDILGQLAASYRKEHEAVVRHAAEVTDALVRASARARPGSVPNADVMVQAMKGLVGAFDPQYGGMGHGTKFPTSSNYLFLLRYHRRTGDNNALDMVTKTLDSMINGGIYDHVGGGFHRYTTERTWLVPHFEKMLYDNGQMVSLLLEAYQVTARHEYADKARGTLDYVAREMRDSRGGFYSATDADSDGEEGLFFVWTPAQLEQLLEPDQARVVKAHFGVTERGNFEHRTTILSVDKTIEAVAKQENLSVERVRELLASARKRLYAARQERVHPGLDDKVLASWNGLMISAFARAALVLDDAGYLDVATRAADNIVATLFKQGRLRRSALGGVASDQLGFLDDYASVLAAFLDLFEASGQIKWLERALDLQRVLDEVFADQDAGGYFFESSEHEALLTKQKPEYDGAEPAGNSVEAENLLRLWKLTDDDKYRDIAESLFGAFAETLKRHPMALSRMLVALDFYLDKPFEIVLVAPISRDGIRPFLDELRKTFLPNRVLISAVGEGGVGQFGALSPLVEGKNAQGGKPTAYVCLSGVCKRPATDGETFRQQLKAVVPYYSAAVAAERA